MMGNILYRGSIREEKVPNRKMGYERRILRTLLSISIVLASFVTVYGDRDNNFMQQKQFRNIVPSPLIQKWRENQMGPSEEKISNEEWKDELLSNLRNVLRKHNPSSRSRDRTDITAYGLQEPLPQLPADVSADQLFILEGASPNSPLGNYEAETPIDEDKRNGFFFGKRNGFFFGKRSGSEVSATKVDDDRLSKFESSGSFDKCRPCGPRSQGRCVMVGTCCSPQFGCYLFTPEAAACMTEDVSPCQLNAPSCGLEGQCVANGICCSAAEGACHLDPTCTSMSLN
ncbi:uncharacterized protein LOC129272917 isoform X2 [Lytechinus pictus]|uniref:uncharacterized protein LOC129272917 isoform X2 n=1 Tax=Lytechinus pictus TaxID=7653 RepID=UPI0030BA0403